ncbi:hypothetical protein [uncultured Shewanella sp.]|uniref:hypothetical protein n=1 Tax=uncultured Shewanella sp. TaxID=173975 RepID=UPI0026060D06|nr:hypothetical protein [uncultured Shewanella sp.]
MLPIEDHTDVATLTTNALHQANVSYSATSEKPLLIHEKMANQPSPSKVSHTQDIAHQPVSPTSNSVPVNRGATFVPLGTQVYLSFIQHDLVEIQPQYQLAFEFSPPEIPLFKAGYRIDANHPSWFLTTSSTHARVSGWKESNLIYRFTQQIS